MSMPPPSQLCWPDGPDPARLISTNRSAQHPSRCAASFGWTCRARNARRSTAVAIAVAATSVTTVAEEVAGIRRSRAALGMAQGAPATEGLASGGSRRLCRSTERRIVSGEVERSERPLDCCCQVPLCPFPPISHFYGWNAGGDPERSYIRRKSSYVHVRAAAQRVRSSCTHTRLSPGHRPSVMYTCSGVLGTAVQGPPMVSWRTRGDLSCVRAGGVSLGSSGCRSIVAPPLPQPGWRGSPSARCGRG